MIKPEFTVSGGSCVRLSAGQCIYIVTGTAFVTFRRPVEHHDRVLFGLIAGDSFHVGLPHIGVKGDCSFSTGTIGSKSHVCSSLVERMVFATAPVAVRIAWLAMKQGSLHGRKVVLSRQQSEIAEWAWTTRETAGLILAQWKHQGVRIVGSRHYGHYVFSLDRLERIVNDWMGAALDCAT